MVRLDVGFKLLDRQVAGFHRFLHVLEHPRHLLHLLVHGLHLLLGRSQSRIVLVVANDCRVDDLGKALRHLLGTRPVHVLDEQVASNFPQVWVALQQLGHGLQRLLALGGKAWAGDNHDIVLADAGVINFLNDDALLVPDLLDRLGLHRVDLDHLGLAVLADDPGDALGVVDFGDQIDQLPPDVADEPGVVVHVVVRAGVRLFLPRQDGLAAALVRCHAQSSVVLAGGRLDVVSRASLGLQQPAGGHRGLCPLG